MRIPTFFMRAAMGETFAFGTLHEGSLNRQSFTADIPDECDF